MDKIKHPSLMEHQHMYKRTWREPTPTLDGDTFKVLWKKQRLAEIRDAILRGDWPHPVPSDSDSSDDDGGSASTNSSNSPRHHKHHHHSQDSDDDPEFEEALQEAADAQLHVVLASLKEQHERELQASRAAAQQIEEEHTATTKQMADIQAQLDGLKREKHELFQQLKLVNQAAAREAAAAAAAAQQAAFQQQQRQWQQHQQMPPPPSLPPLQQGQTPFHAASHGNQPSPAGGMHPQQPQPQPTTPRVAGQPLQTSSSGLMSPAARANWPCSSPQQPPPPPPPRHVDGAGSSGGGGTPSYQQQQQQRMGSLVPPAFQQHQQQPQPQAQQQYTLGLQGTWAGAGPGQQQQQQQQQGPLHQPLGRAQSDVQHWASTERGGHRLDRMGSDRLERLSSSGFDGSAHAAAGGHHAGREGCEQQRQAHMQPAQQQQQGGIGAGGMYGRSPREGSSGRRGKPVLLQEFQAPDSPEEGEALPSPPGPAMRKQIAALEARSAAASAAAAAGGGGGVAGGGAGPFEPGSTGTVKKRPARVALDRAPSGGMHGAPGGNDGPAGGGGSSGGYRVPAAHTDAAQQVEGGRGAAPHAGVGGSMLTGLRRSSSGGSSSGMHVLSPLGAAQRLPSTPSDPTLGRGLSGAVGGVGGYRGCGMPGSASGPGSAGGHFGRGREESGSLPTPWQNDRRRSSNEGWDRFGALGQEGGSAGPAPAGPGAGKPWGRAGGRGRGGYHGRA